MNIQPKRRILLSRTKLNRDTTQMNTIHLNGANAEAIAELMGGTLILVDLTADTAMIAGGDITRLVEVQS